MEKMDLKQYIARMQAVKAVIANTKFVTENIALVAGKQLEAEFGRRIFLKGLDTNNAAIGKYSTRPLYINPNARLFDLLPKFKKSKPRLKPIGKTGQTVFKNGKPHKTAYLAGGYAEFRTKVGRQPSAKLQKLGGITAGGVNLNLTGSMATNLNLNFSKKSVSLGFSSPVEYAKAKANERHFGTVIFAASKKEKTNFAAAASREFSRLVALAYNNAIRVR
jgi:hypothetical protein